MYIYIYIYIYVYMYPFFLSFLGFEDPTWAGMHPRANQFPKSISLTTKKHSAQGSFVPVPPH